jgi:hydroxyethylthiazole kinase
MKKPLIHLITNYVTVNDVVNMILACGGTAICADAPEEVEEITSLADALVLNIGTPSRSRFEAMLKAGHKADEKGIPVVLDPVGAGSSRFRDDFLKRLLDEVRVDCIRGNVSEIYALSGNTLGDTALGVEASGDIPIRVAEDSATALADKLNTIVVMTGKNDFVTDGEQCSEWPDSSGSYMQKLITGSGCMLSGLMGLALTEESDYKYETISNYLDMYNKAASDAEIIMKKQKVEGTATFRRYLFDMAHKIFYAPLEPDGDDEL